MNHPLLSKATFNEFLLHFRHPLDLHACDIQNALNLYPNSIPQQENLRFSVYLGEAKLSAFPKVRSYLRKYPAEAQVLHKKLYGNLWAEFSSDEKGNTAWVLRADPHETGYIPQALNGAFHCLPSLRYRGDPGSQAFLRDISHSLGVGFTEDPFRLSKQEELDFYSVPAQSVLNRLCYEVFKGREQEVQITNGSSRLLERFINASVSGPFLIASVSTQRSEFEERSGTALLILEGYHDDQERKLYFNLTLTGNARTDSRLASVSLPYAEVNTQGLSQAAVSLRQLLNEVYATRQEEIAQEKAKETATKMEQIKDDFDHHTLALRLA